MPNFNEYIKEEFPGAIVCEKNPGIMSKNSWWLIMLRLFFYSLSGSSMVMGHFVFVESPLDQERM